MGSTRAANKVNEITALSGGGWATPAYDAVGNMTTLPLPASPSTSDAAIYDAWNRLMSNTAAGGVPIDGARYDGLGRRVSRFTYAPSQTADFFYSDNWQVLEERLASGGIPARRFVWGTRYLDDLILRDINTDRTYPLQDPNWNVTSLCDSSGVIERYSYAAYGQPTFRDANFNPLTASVFQWETLFAGYRWDAESGLYYVRHRYLNSTLGNWLSRDPLLFMQLGWNLYAYSSDKPTIKVDPLGLLDCYCAPKDCTGLKPINALLNSHINSQIRKAVNDACNSQVLLDVTTLYLRAIRNRLGKDVPGTGIGDIGVMTKVETWIRSLVNSKEYAAYVKQGSRIKNAARRFRFADCILVTCGKKKYCIGSDKIGHFFQQGFMLYEFKLARTKAAAKSGFYTAAEAEEYGQDLAHALSEWFEGIKPTDKVQRKVLGRATCSFYDFEDADIDSYFGKWGGGWILQKSYPDTHANDAGLEFYEGQAQTRPLGHSMFDICRYVRSNWREW